MYSDLFKEKLAEKEVIYLIKGALVVSSLCLLFDLYNLFNQTRHYFIKEADGLSFEASKRDFCTMALEQMIHKNLSKKIIASGLYETIVADHYKNMFFEDDDKVSSVYLGENKCKALVKTKDGLRSFDLFLEEGDEPDFHYQITKVRENELFEKES